ncbi:DUF1847 domain-containing protein [Maridesulfovibrio bastinii]|jgi:uncharacterized metal-binding protein|uniref:DUF1847 domain-containing protein n=1 Tax=Maridesulfovibrio bastinii TaxID=47157 RepID=UPI0004152EC3|nr:DUF1847 domain-containing protein [Maridesulfovibrio bastinii]
MSNSEKTNDDLHPACALCPFDWSERYCRKKGGKAPKNCPSIRYRELAKLSLEEFKKDPQVLEFAKQASLQETSGYAGRDKGYAHLRPAKPRIQEIVEFARRMKYKRVALAFCIGLRKEAAIVHQIFETNDLDVISIACKVSRTSKCELGLTQADQIDTTVEDETMCNPVLQAMIANENEVDMCVLLGLCVGHDSLFIKHAEAPVTVLAVKDRLLGHAPLAAINQYDAYYRNLKFPIPEDE